MSTTQDGHTSSSANASESDAPRSLASGLLRSLGGVIDLPIRSEGERAHAAPPALPKVVDLPGASQLAPGAQQRRNDCGPACVRMAFDFLGLAPGVSIDQLAAEADPPDDGTTAQDLVTLAASYGAAATALYLPAGQLPDPPAILLVRYSGFRRESVENAAYWDLAAANAGIWHWMWWLGNVQIDGQWMSVWNDPLYIAGSGKNVLHTLEELTAAFQPYGNARIAVKFAAIQNPSAEDEATLIVAPFDSGGVNFRRAPGTQDPTTIIRLLPQGHRLTVLEKPSVARIKMSGGQYWLRVRTTLDGVQRDGYVAAWLVRPVEDMPPPTPTPTPTPIVSVSYTWQDVINATVIVATPLRADWNAWLRDAGFWAVFNNALRALPYTGPAVDRWPIARELRQRIAELLKLSSAELVQKVIEVVQQAEQEQQLPRPQQPVPGAIVGIHGPPGVGCPPRADWDRWIKVLHEMGILWYKQCDDGDLNQRDIFEWCKRLKAEGIEPIIRYFKDRQFPNPLPDAHFEKMRRYADAGMVWAEIGNEPNLDHEWQQSWWGRVDFNNPEVIRLLAEGWVRDAQRALQAGVRPAFYAMGPTDWRGGVHPTLSSVYFTSRLALYLAERRRDETLDIFRRGAWFAVHCATYEQPDDFDPFRPDGTIWDVTLRGYEIVIKCFRDAFGPTLDVDHIPIMSTEGGVFTPESTSMAGHIRLNSEAEHAERVVSMFRWLERHSPLQAMCPWCLSAHGFGGPFDPRFEADGWFVRTNGSLRERPVVQAMRQLFAERTQLAARPKAFGLTVEEAVPILPTVRRALLDIGVVVPSGTGETATEQAGAQTSARVSARKTRAKPASKKPASKKPVSKKPASKSTRKTSAPQAKATQKKTPKQKAPRRRKKASKGRS
ncbi:MAG: cysteine peptidase family C39 domain-containing protein [Anaerolineae bacterium]|nr:cysteine peptidase family C39 domain-containing protein [Thermoflexales bacterium]MDW8407927.1 cysteine peptidase family C39 domain-containing protein [Anaerolineae bacterium]